MKPAIRMARVTLYNIASSMPPLWWTLATTFTSQSEKRMASSIYLPQSIVDIEHLLLLLELGEASRNIRSGDCRGDGGGGQQPGHRPHAQPGAGGQSLEPSSDHDGEAASARVTRLRDCSPVLSPVPANLHVLLLELSTLLCEISQCPENAPTRTLLKIFAKQTVCQL